MAGAGAGANGQGEHLRMGPERAAGSVLTEPDRCAALPEGQSAIGGITGGTSEGQGGLGRRTCRGEEGWALCGLSCSVEECQWG